MSGLETLGVVLTVVMLALGVWRYYAAPLSDWRAGRSSLVLQTAAHYVVWRDSTDGAVAEELWNRKISGFNPQKSNAVSNFIQTLTRDRLRLTNTGRFVAARPAPNGQLELRQWLPF